MKRLFLPAVWTVFLGLIFSITAYADNYITREDIAEGMRFCGEFPVKLTLDGEEILFGENDIPPLIVKSRTLIPARALFESMGGLVFWDEERHEVEIHLGNSAVVLGIGSTSAWVNGEETELEVPAMIIAKEGEYYGRTMIPLRFTAESLGYDVDWNDEEREVIIITPAAREDQEDSEQDEEKDMTAHDPETSFWKPFLYEPLDMLNEIARERLIFIDVGHGGRDTGAIANEKTQNELFEKDVNLKVALYLKEFLYEANANAYFVREKDEYFAMLERPEIANSINAQLYVSIHNNSSDYYWPKGTEVHYYDKVDEEGRDEMELYGIYSKNVAQSVHKELISTLGTYDRGVKRSPKYAVLNKTEMPAILIEGAFLSNAEDFEIIRTDEYARRYAYAVAKGLIAAMNEAYKIPY